MDCSLPGSFVHGIFPGKNTTVGCHFLLQGIFRNPGMEPMSPALAGGLFTIEPPGKLYTPTLKKKEKGKENADYSGLQC